MSPQISECCVCKKSLPPHKLVFIGFGMWKCRACCGTVSFAVDRKRRKTGKPPRAARGGP